MVDFEIIDGKLKIDCRTWAIPPSIEDSSAAMGVVFNLLKENRGITGLILSSTVDVEYPTDQVKLLLEIVDVYHNLLNVYNILSMENLGCNTHAPKRYEELKNLLTEVLRKDPIGAYVKINMMIRDAQNITDAHASCYQTYLERALLPVKHLLERTRLIQKIKKDLLSFRFGDRSLYRKIFNPFAKPAFMMSYFSIFVPKDFVLIDKYKIGEIGVEIYRDTEHAKYYYYIIPHEFKLSEEEQTLINAAREYLSKRRPLETEVGDLRKIRDIFFDISYGLIRDLSNSLGINITQKEIQRLAEILVRHTTGFGVLEILLSDEKIQDVYINAPVGSSPIYIYHSDFEECETNIILTKEGAESLAARFRLYSGRPLDEANPVLDTEIIVPGGRARVAAITKTLSPEGLSFAFRRHREKSWTFPLFIKYKMLDPLYAGLMSFIIDGGRSVLVAGGRGAGKTSLLSAMMLEVMRKFRIVVQEDTLELPVDQLRQLGYNIERLKSRSVITRVETELAPDDALRTALRLGDSVLIVGEVRSVESTVLFEAMRIGALSNLVAGTIHGESAYGVFDRVVHDLKLPTTSFKALDILTICNMLKSPDGLHRFRKVTEITEVRKKWKEDPADEGGFVPLMVYSAKEDKLKPTETLLSGESEVLNQIANRTREWHGAWDLVWENILLRAKIKQTILDFSEKLGRPELLEAEWVVRTNEMFHIISESVLKEVGSTDSKMIYDRWLNWFKEAIK